MIKKTVVRGREKIFYEEFNNSQPRKKSAMIVAIILKWGTSYARTELMCHKIKSTNIRRKKVDHDQYLLIRSDIMNRA